MEEISYHLKKYMDGLAGNNYFNGAVLVGYKGEILLKESYGWSSFQYKVLNETTTKFRIGSLTKAFTAMAILKLHEQGLLQIEESVVKIFPEYSSWGDVSIHHLLNNTSGIPNFTSFPEYWTKTMRLPTTIYHILDSLKDLPLEFKPGEKMDYCNSGYLLLTAIIEKVSGKSYSDFLQESILNTLMLKNTGVDNGRKIVDSLSTGHTVWEEVIHTDFIDMSFPEGAYGIYSTVDDLFNWSQALMSGILVNQHLQDQMFTGEPYGYGWFLEEQPQKKARHFGDINGYVNNIELNFKEELVIIILSNINITPVTKISHHLANIVGDNSIKKIHSFSRIEDTIPLEKLVGTYLDGGQRVEIHVNQELFVTILKMYGVPYKFKLIPISVSFEKIVFKSDYIDETYEFNLNAQGDIQSLIHIDYYEMKKEYKKRNDG